MATTHADCVSQILKAIANAGKDFDVVLKDKQKGRSGNV